MLDTNKAKENSFFYSIYVLKLYKYIIYILSILHVQCFIVDLEFYVIDCIRYFLSGFIYYYSTTG